MTASKRVGFIVALFLASPFFMISAPMGDVLAIAWLRPVPGLLAAMPKLPETLGRLVWLAVECLPLLVWPSWRDVGSLRPRWSWTVLAPFFCLAVNLSGFNGWSSAHPLTGALDVVCNVLLIAANEEVLFRGHMFHDRPSLHPRVTVLTSSVVFGLFHYGNLAHAGWQGVTWQVSYAFFIGLSFGTIRLATGGLGWCILIHWWIDATDGFTGRSSVLNFLVAVTAGPSWLILSVLLLYVHPALRLPSATAGMALLSPPTVVSSRWRLVRLVVAILSGAVAGLALILALFCLLTPRKDPVLTQVAAPVLIGCLALPGGLLALSVARWARWRHWPSTPTLDAAPADALPLCTPPGSSAVKLGAALLCFVSLMAILFLALYVTGRGFKADLALLRGAWKHPWQDAWRLSSLVLSLFSAPALFKFSLHLAIRPRCSRDTLLCWSYAAFFFGVFTVFAYTRWHLRLVEMVVLRIDVWYIAVVGGLVALLLAVHDLHQLRRARQFAPVTAEDGAGGC